MIAREISGPNLLGTDWVGSSACETGVGKTTIGEGSRVASNLSVGWRTYGDDAFMVYLRYRDSIDHNGFLSGDEGESG
jgi:hypothetical protein